MNPSTAVYPPGPAGPAAPAVPGAVREPRPPLLRPVQDRMIGGVATGLADHLGWPVSATRWAFVGLAVTGGAGVVLYLWLWALAPSADSRAQALGPGPSGDLDGPAGTSGGSPSGDGTADGGVRPSGTTVSGLVGHMGDVLLGVLLLAAAGSIVSARFGWAPPPSLVLPVLVVGGGAVLAYGQLDRVERARWVERTGVGTRGAVLRVAAGLVVVLAGVLLLVVRQTDLESAGRTLTAAAAVLAGVALVLAPWGVRLWRDLDAERSARARETERAEIAAHLHDSVLQTLALIQRSSGDAAQVARLARAQERDLRSWLYGPRRTSAEATVAAAVKEAEAEIEDRHAVPVDVVVVGDGPLDEPAAALVAALREATLNAVRHGGAPVSVYVEVGKDAVEAFVRDRGPGFDLAAVPADRHGVRSSIIGRMERHGGTAKVISSSDGTEVRLVLPRGTDADRVAPAEPGDPGESTSPRQEATP